MKMMVMVMEKKNIRDYKIRNHLRRKTIYNGTSIPEDGTYGNYNIIRNKVKYNWIYNGYQIS